MIFQRLSLSPGFSVLFTFSAGPREADENVPKDAMSISRETARTFCQAKAWLKFRDQFNTTVRRIASKSDMLGMWEHYLWLNKEKSA
jgi:hypothetical protein